MLKIRGKRRVARPTIDCFGRFPGRLKPRPMICLQPSRTIESMTARSSRPLRVHALISSLTWGGAEMLLSEFAAGAPSAGVELSVGFLDDRDGEPSGLRASVSGGSSPSWPRTPTVGCPCSIARITGWFGVSSQRCARTWLHTHLGYADMFGGLAARPLGIPVVSTIHIMEWDRDPRARPKDYARERLMSFVRRRWTARPSSPFRRQRVGAYLDTGWDRPEHVVTVHNGVAGVPWPGAGRAARAELGLSPADPSL